MKKLLTVVLSVLLCTSAFAQFGIIGGWTSASTQLSFDQLSTKNVNHFHLGIAYKIPVGALLTVQPALEYNVKGADISLPDIPGSNVVLSTGFVELPVQLQLGLNLHFFRLFALGEPFVGYAVNNTSSIQLTQDKWGDVANRFEYGIGAGGGVELFDHLQITARYYWNMAPLYSFDIKGVNLANTKCGGVKISAAILF